jgi:acyl carrier protein
MTMRKISAEEISDWLVDRIATERNMEPEAVPLDEAFFAIGLNSLDTLLINNDLADFLELEELSPSLFWDYPSIEKLSAHLAER